MGEEEKKGRREGESTSLHAATHIKTVLKGARMCRRVGGWEGRRHTMGREGEVGGGRLCGQAW